MRSEIQQIWRQGLVRMLQEKFAVPEEEAQPKIDRWLKWVTQNAWRNTTSDLPEN